MVDFQNVKNIFREKKYLYWITGFFVIVLITWAYFWVKYYIDYKIEKKLEQVNTIIAKDDFSKDNCEIVLDFDKSIVPEKNKTFDKTKFEDFFNRCNNMFNLNYIDLSLENCTDLIKQQKSFFEEKYIIIDKYEEKINECTSKYLEVNFWTWIFFNVENDFKSSIYIDFSLDFFTDTAEENSEEFIENRVEAKKRLFNLIEIEPKVNFTIDDIYLYPNKAILNLPLQPLTEYKIKLKPFKTKIWEDTNKQEFIFVTPENKYFWMKVINKVTLFKDTDLPKFQILEYNSDKTTTKVKVCKVSTENYAKMEVFRKDGQPEAIKDFFINKIDNLEKTECNEKEISFKDNNTSSWITLIKKDFNFDDYFQKLTPKDWLYVVYFSDKNHREYNQRLNYPIFFWVINSHITMKISRNNEAFFFVNDFYWKPLANQEIKVNLNNFEQKQQNRNEQNQKYEEVYFSPLDKSVFSTWVVLWKTWKDWILKVNIKEKIPDAFLRTFTEDRDYNYQGLYKTFFVTSSWDNYLSYVNSTWNAWIAPWNFGYRDGYRDYRISNPDQDWVTINRRESEEPEYYSHVYTDRMLYLPWEEVNIKSVIRKSYDISIPKDKKVILKITDSKQQEIYNKTLTITEFWSISDKLSLAQTAPLWYYNINLELDWINIWYWSFSVEVFKNPKFKNEILLETEWLNDSLVKIDKTEVKKNYYRNESIYSWKFKINWKVFSKYYNWNFVKNADFEYKIYKQYYYDDSYWNDCYYWCYWEPEKEFYSEWKWKLDENWLWKFSADVKFESNYSDYKYIVEVTVKDSSWDVISWTNSIIAKLPEEYKWYNNDLSINFKSENKFVKAWNNVVIDWWLNTWKWNEYYDNKYVFIIKKKDYEIREVNDVNWYKRPITISKEKLENIFFINKTNFKLTSDWKLQLNYKLKETWEYIFEYGKIDVNSIYDYLGYVIPDNNENQETKIDDKKESKQPSFDDIKKLVEEFNTIKKSSLERSIIEDKTFETCEKNKDWENINCFSKTKKVNTVKKLKLNSLLDSYEKKYFSVLTYGDSIANNPVNNDNKIRVVPEKISYSLWEKAKVMIRLPISNAKILWTIEKQWVIKTEYINVKWNTFFKEFVVDDTFVPNAYIWVVMVDTRNEIIPEYKVWYTEVVVDKTDKKSFITITKDKKQYKPREKVSLYVNVKNKKQKPVKSELTVMVVDDSLISLMWNVDLNTLEKFFKKLPFSIQTSITNIAMLKNYYFSRPGLVWWSWFGNFKWWDSAVSTRNIFKNTAYYNANIVTDNNWNAKIEFTLPDNLTNFRVMVISNSKDNFFGYSEENLEVRKSVIIEDKTPIILREDDKTTIWANIFNNTKESIWFKVELTVKDVQVNSPTKNITIWAWDSQYISWSIFNDYNKDKIEYTISALWNNAENSDKIQGIINVKESPILINNITKTWKVKAKWSIDLDIDIPENISLEKSEVEIIFSNNKLIWIEKIVSSLAKYPYWCVEQTTSTTLPNAILKKFKKIFTWIEIKDEEIDKNLNYWIERIKWMQTSDWWFAYWPWNSNSDLHISPYVVRSLIDMKNAWATIPGNMIESWVKYLENNLKDLQDDLQKSEIFWTLSKAGKKPNIQVNLENLDRHSLIAYTYWLVLNNKWKNETIDKNIEKIKWMLNNSETYYRYWDDNSDKAIFASMLMDYDYNLDYINNLVFDLYDNDWSSYYYSTQAKNNAFITFYKYLEKYQTNNKSVFWFMIWSELNREAIFTVWWWKSNIYRKKYNLKDLLNDNKKLWFKIANLEWSDLFVDIVLKHYPQDKLKVKPFSNKMTVSREIFEVLNETKLTECWENYYYDENYNTRKDCENIFSKVTNNVFEKEKLYKTKITVKLNDSKNRTNLVVEDYLPAWFRVINPKFKTESVNITQNKNSWNWDHIEYKPDVVMANSSYIWWNEIEFEYYFRPEFEWTYTYPPVTSYLMYNPIIRANNWFNIINIK